MSGIEFLTPRQQRVGRRAVRFLEIGWAHLVVPCVLLLCGGLTAFLSQRALVRDPVDALWLAGSAGFGIATAGVMILDASSLALLGILYRRLQQASSDEHRATPGHGVPLAARDLPEAERRLVENAGKLERVGWGSVRGGLLVVLASGIAVVAAALWRFGSEDGGLGTAALAMAATGGLTVGVALGGIVVTRWMRLAARLGSSSPGRTSPV
jgi:hypothetical protein